MRREKIDEKIVYGYRREQESKDSPSDSVAQKGFFMKGISANNNLRKVLVLLYVFIAAYNSYADGRSNSDIIQLMQELESKIFGPIVASYAGVGASMRMSRYGPEVPKGWSQPQDFAPYRIPENSSHRSSDNLSKPSSDPKQWDLARDAYLEYYLLGSELAWRTIPQLSQNASFLELSAGMDSLSTRRLTSAAAYYAFYPAASDAASRLWNPSKINGPICVYRQSPNSDAYLILFPYQMFAANDTHVVAPGRSTGQGRWALMLSLVKTNTLKIDPPHLDQYGGGVLTSQYNYSKCEWTLVNLQCRTIGQ